MRDLMDDRQAVEETCRIGQKIEADLRRAEDEAFIRSWQAMPNGGHDPDFMRKLQETGDLAW